MYKTTTARPITSSRPTVAYSTGWNGTSVAAHPRKCDAADPLTCRFHGVEANPWMADMIRRCKADPFNPAHKQRLTEYARSLNMNEVLVEAFADKLDYLRFLGPKAALEAMNNLQLQTAIFTVQLRRGKDLRDPRKELTPTQIAERNAQIIKRKADSLAYNREHKLVHCEYCDKLCFETLADAERFVHFKRGQANVFPNRVFAYTCRGSRKLHISKTQINPVDGSNNEEVAPLA